ncbi:hypothetical protein E4U41_006717 [Claviceps citrina]|nr:hypothetical protein E4U41_006717 [Claviceps citrina]
MAAAIKPIDEKSIHLIQSGQVIVDLCSVVKELVENSIDSGANTIDVRFKNQGLDQIEVQDNGCGISPANHPFVALKHHTSKLSSYSDIGSLQTFGFRGEALASLCALSQITITTCIEPDVPKGSRLSFDTSGKLCSTALSAAQRGTTVSVEALFHKLPVRRRELERNIKREWHKVIVLLNQYACIQTNLRFSVWQQPTKGKRVLLFSTKGNPTTRENIINIFGSKSMASLVPMDMVLEMEPSRMKPATQGSPPLHHPSRQVRVRGHVSRPVHGEGRQTPDRQMFFVNGRPCGLPQFSKTFNEVYKSYNYSQSPFIFADIQLDTNMYDVNVSPDKRSILLHDQSSLLDSIRTSLGALFDSHDHRLPATSVLSSQPSQSQISLPPAPSLITLKVPPIGEEHVSINDDAETNGRSPTASLGRGVRPSLKKGTDQGNRTVGRQSSVRRWLNQDVERERSPVFGVKASNIDKTELELRKRRTLADDPTGNLECASDLTSNDSDVGSSSSKETTQHDRDHGLKSTKELLRQTSHAGSDMKNVHDDLSSPCSKRHALSTEESLTSGDEGYVPESEVRNGVAASIVHHPNSSAEGGNGNRQDIHSRALGIESQNRQQSGSDLNVKIGQKDASRDRNGKKVSDQAAPVKANVTIDGKKRTFANAKRLQVICTTEDKIARSSAFWGQDYARNLAGDFKADIGEIDAADAESKLSLMISKNDFARMRVVGQFNLGFIIAIRPGSTNSVQSATDAQDDLLIIDQHASDEKFNFEKLQANTIVQSQRLVHPKMLNLTALEEEIVLQNLRALEANGFQVQVDTTGAAPVGSRCQLLALPLSRELTFTLKDLEDLISLLADEPAGSEHIPRPSAVRKMFAMRACRSSIMIGKALTTSQMYTIVRHMGELDQPWNCPHGRPTMRHLCRIQALDEARWIADTLSSSSPDSWASYMANTASGS